MPNLAIELRKLMEQLDSLAEFAPGEGGATNYYVSTENFINNYRQNKEEELETLTSGGHSPEEIEQWKQGVSFDLKKFENVRDGFMRGLRAGFETYEKIGLDTYLKDQLGCHWINDDLDLNSDWETVFGEEWGNDENC